MTGKYYTKDTVQYSAQHIYCCIGLFISNFFDSVDNIRSLAEVNSLHMLLVQCSCHVAVNISRARDVSHDHDMSLAHLQ